MATRPNQFIIGPDGSITQNPEFWNNPANVGGVQNYQAWQNEALNERRELCLAGLESGQRQGHRGGLRGRLHAGTEHAGLHADGHGQIRKAVVEG